MGEKHYINFYQVLKQVLRENAEQVLQNNGLLISEEQYIDKKADKFSIIKSCRIQAGIPQGLLLIQSSMDGGSRFAAKAFCRLRRPHHPQLPVLKKSLSLAKINSQP